MRVHIILLSLLCTVVAKPLLAQHPVFLADKKVWLQFNDKEVSDSSGRELKWFIKGNILFKGSGDDRENIYWMTTNRNFFSNKQEYLYERNQREPTFTFMSGTIYTGRENVTDENAVTNSLVYAVQSGKWTAFYAAYNDTLLAYFAKDSLPAFAAIVVAYELVGMYDLVNKQAPKPVTGVFKDARYATIKPAWGNVTANEWVWDGTVLRPRWNTDPRFYWTFDGTTIKPLYVNNVNEHYEWNGELFKPVWRTSRNEEWMWDGRLLKPVWSTDWSQQYTVEPNLVRPWSNVHSEREWYVEGDFPYPIIILVISGIARAQ